MKNFILLVILFFCLVAGLFAQPSNKVVVGYLPTYNNFPGSVNGMDLSIVTHINIAFVNPNTAGAVNMPNGLATVVNAAHAQGVKVLISLAGGGASATTYQTVLGNDNLRSTFIQNLVNACNTYNLDGVDVDIEGDVLNGNNVTAAMYERFILELQTAMHSRNWLMTAALGTWFSNLVTNRAAAAFDFINIMAYDATGTWTGPGQHSSYQFMLDCFNTWRNKGVPANKLVCGVPFYGWSWGSYGTRAWTFNEITTNHAGAENQDQVGSGNNVIYYNGIPTITQKSQWAFENCLGVMYWEETQDANGANSLLAAIGRVFGSHVSSAPENLATGKTVTVSSTEAGANVAGNVNDRDYATRWSSAYNDAEWVAIDLGYTYLLDSIRIFWESAYAAAFEVQVSADGSSWVTLQTIRNNTSTTHRLVYQGQEANHIRINGLSRATNYGYSIYEIEAYGTAKALPYSGTPASIPGTLQAEDYDLGGAGVAYYDLSLGNQFNAYRSDDVDLETCNDQGGGYHVGSAQAGEWLNYTVEVLQAGWYDLAIRVATQQEGQRMHFTLDGVDLTGSIALPNTGAWQNFETIDVPGLQLPAGTHQLRLHFDTEYFNVNYFSFDAPTVTGLESKAENSIRAYPNPTAGVLKVELNEEGLLSLLDASGRLLFQQTCNAGILEMDCSPYAQGLYWLSYENTAGTGVIPLQIKR